MRPGLFLLQITTIRPIKSARKTAPPIEPPTMALTSTFWDFETSGETPVAARVELALVEEVIMLEFDSV